MNKQDTQDLTDGRRYRAAREHGAELGLWFSKVGPEDYDAMARHDRIWERRSKAYTAVQRDAFFAGVFGKAYG